MHYEYITNKDRETLYDQIGRLLTSHGRSPRESRVKPQLRQVVSGAGFERASHLGLGGQEIYVEEVQDHNVGPGLPLLQTGRSVHTGRYEWPGKVFKTRHSFLVAPGDSWDLLEIDRMPNTILFIQGKELVRMLRALEETNAKRVFGVVRLIKG